MKKWIIYSLLLILFSFSKLNAQGISNKTLAVVDNAKTEFKKAKADFSQAKALYLKAAKLKAEAEVDSDIEVEDGEEVIDPIFAKAKSEFSKAKSEFKTAKAQYSKVVNAKDSKEITPVLKASKKDRKAAKSKIAAKKIKKQKKVKLAKATKKVKKPAKTLVAAKSKTIAEEIKVPIIAPKVVKIVEPAVSVSSKELKVETFEIAKNEVKKAESLVVVTPEKVVEEIKKKKKKVKPSKEDSKDKKQILSKEPLTAVNKVKVDLKTAKAEFSNAKTLYLKAVKEFKANVEANPDLVKIEDGEEVILDSVFLKAKAEFSKSKSEFEAVKTQFAKVVKAKATDEVVTALKTSKKEEQAANYKRSSKKLKKRKKSKKKVKVKALKTPKVDKKVNPVVFDVLSVTDIETKTKKEPVKEIESVKEIEPLKAVVVAAEKVTKKTEKPKEAVVAVKKSAIKKAKILTPKVVNTEKPVDSFKSNVSVDKKDYINKKAPYVTKKQAIRLGAVVSPKQELQKKSEKKSTAVSSESVVIKIAKPVDTDASLVAPANSEYNLESQVKKYKAPKAIVKKIELPKKPVVYEALKSVKSVSILNFLKKSKKHSTLLKLFEASELDLATIEANSFTLFAPTNLAFEKLPRKTVDTLLLPENRMKLKVIVKNHILGKGLDTSKLPVPTDVVKKKKKKKKRGVVNPGIKYKTLNGNDLSVSDMGGIVTVGYRKGKKAFIETANRKQDNGIIHIVDTVFLPN